ncbi:hypothetical protein NQZ68_016154 [Dissostichus eleginoides]|nr:hypothetical protein NQZ68_016154 [Dissostichus eleginoides]
MHLLQGKTWQQSLQKNLKNLIDPTKEMKVIQELCQPLEVMLRKALPNTRLTRDGLKQEVKIAACSPVDTEIINHLNPIVCFAADTKPHEL